MNGSCVNELSYKEDLKALKTHSHNAYQMVYIEEGSAVFNISDRQYSILKPSVVFIGDKEYHSIVPTDKVYRRFAVSIDPETAHKSIRDERLLCALSNSGGLITRVMNTESLKDQLNPLFDLLYKEISFKSSSFDSPADLYIESILKILYRADKSAFPKSGSSTDEAITSVKRIIENEYYKDFTLEKISKQFNISLYYLAHKFKAQTGSSIKQYLISCRISAAKKLLDGTDLPISEICFKTGFTDLSNFSRYFSKTVGMSPTEYRKRQYSITR